MWCGCLLPFFPLKSEHSRKERQSTFCLQISRWVLTIYTRESIVADARVGASASSTTRAYVCVATCQTKTDWLTTLRSSPIAGASIPRMFALNKRIWLESHKKGVQLTYWQMFRALHVPWPEHTPGDPAGWLKHTCALAIVRAKVSINARRRTEYFMGPGRMGFVFDIRSRTEVAVWSAGASCADSQKIGEMVIIQCL